MKAADAKSGAVLWTYSLLEETGSAEVHGRMLIDGNTLYVPADSEIGGYLYAIDRLNGTTRWRAATEKAARAGGFSTDVLRHGSLIITITAANELVAFDATTGKLAWLRPLASGGRPRRQSAAYFNGRLFLTDRSTLLGVDAASGNVLWRRPLGAAAPASPAVLHGRIYVGLADNRLVSVAPGDGTLLHSIALPRPAASAPAAVGNAIVVLSGESEIVAADVELSKVLWRRAAGGEWTVPRIETWRDLAVVGDSRGSVILLDPATGSPTQSFHVDGRPRGIAVTPDVLYVGTLEGDVFSVRPGHPVGDVSRGDGAGHRH